MGTLYGIGLGPGDPELVTLKAARLLRQVPVIAYPAAEGGTSLARAIAAPLLPGGQAEIAISLCMSVDARPAQQAYDRAAEAIARELAAGHDVALLCEGDPFYYGSFLYVFERLAGRFPVEIVPGISSLMAGAAAMRVPLARRNEALTVIPAPLPDAAIEALIAHCDAFCIIKLGRHFGRVRALLDRSGLTSGCHYLAHVGTPAQHVVPLAEAGDEAPYFSMIIGHRKP